MRGWLWMLAAASSQQDQSFDGSAPLCCFMVQIPGGHLLSQAQLVLLPGLAPEARLPQARLAGGFCSGRWAQPSVRTAVLGPLEA